MCYKVVPSPHSLKVCVRADAFSPLLLRSWSILLKETASCQCIPKLHVRSSVFVASLEGLLDSNLGPKMKTFRGVKDVGVDPSSAGKAVSGWGMQGSPDAVSRPRRKTDGSCILWMPVLNGMKDR